MEPKTAPLTLEEYEAVMSFARWFEETKPKVLAYEFSVWNVQEGYAGTVDLFCEIEGEKWIVDFKTSQNVWPSMRLQLSAYLHAEERFAGARLGILQLGYRKNKAGYKFTEVDDCYDLFLATKQIWAAETGEKQPLQRDYPLSVTLNVEPMTAAASSTGTKTKEK